MTVLKIFFLFAATTVSTHGFEKFEAIPLDYKLKEINAKSMQPVNFIENTNGIASARLHTYEEIVKFNIDPAVVARRQVECEESNGFLLNEISWNIKVCRSDGYTNRDAIVELISNFTGDTATWSCEAEATVKLLSPKKNENPRESKLESFTFSKANPSKAFKKFVKWDDMQKNFTVDGTSTFVFDIKTKVPNRSPKSEQISTKFQVRAKQVRSLGEQYSIELVVHGIRWKVLTSKQQDNLAVFICANDNDIELTKSWKASATIKLLHADEDKSVSKPISETTIDWTQTQFGISDFMKWDAFTSNENKYVKNNAAIFDIELNVQVNTD